MGSLDPCSYNHACKCLPLSFADDVGICAVVGASCSRLSPCRFPYDTCDADHICVRHQQCGSNPVCYPLSMADQRLCPLMITIDFPNFIFIFDTFLSTILNYEIH
ncbi:unnamed protein product [Rotaria socialis]|nr:unnamed protein product [Rotaria socialis]CAF3434828.1 unnamed protein product [Rotaria socialis]CAF3456436.1 unnamed protein product [Rotaria socialis]CAF3576231.1 unnamed protein product [Rotaria socialis]